MERTAPNHRRNATASSTAIILLSTCCFHLVVMATAVLPTKASGDPPSSPERFELVDMSWTSATFSWLSEDQITYRLHYKSLSSDESYHSIEDVHSPYTLQGLVTNNRYSVYIVAVNQFGVSQPSAIVSFRLITHADSGSVRIVQSPSGFAVVGSRLVLSCSYVSDSTVGEPVTVTWLRGNLKVESNVFVIESVRRRDEGHYTCLVNAAGHVLSADTVVRVQFAPTVTAAQQSVHADIGHTAHLVCRFTGHPDSISWYHGLTGATVIGSRYSVTRYIHEDSGLVDSRLSIETVGRRDYGPYRCKASNSYSTTDMLVWLTDDKGSTVQPAVDHTASHPIITNAPSQPENVRLSMTSSGQVLVTWEIPTVNSDLVQFYRVNYSTELDGQMRTNSSLVIGNQSLLLTDVKAFTTYEVIVAAGNRDVISLPSVPARITTVELCPSEPWRVKAELIEGVNVKLTWRPPRRNVQFVTSYLVHYIATQASSTGTPSVRQVVSSARHCTVKQLQPNTQYLFYVTATSEHYKSDHSDKVLVSTSDAIKSVTSPTAEFGHKVALAVCMVLVCVAVVVFAIIARRYCCSRSRSLKRKTAQTALNDSMLFDNRDYNRLTDSHDAATIRWSSEVNDIIRSSPSTSPAVNHIHHQQQQQQRRLRDNGCQNYNT